MGGSATVTASVDGKEYKCSIRSLYKDVKNPANFWYKPTYALTDAGVVKGYDAQTRFKPANLCTRAQMVTFIWRLAGSPEPVNKDCKFSDVKESDYFYKACLWGNEKGIVEGYKDGTFGPQINCARKHAVTFLWRLAGKPDPTSDKSKFKDVKESDYFYKATIWASEKKIVAGYDDNTFRPNGDCLRRQMVTFLYKYVYYTDADFDDDMGGYELAVDENTIVISNQIDVDDKTKQIYLDQGAVVSLGFKGADDKTQVTLTSSDKSIVKIGDDISLITLKAGSSDITAKVGDKEYKFKVTVYYKDVKDKSKFWFEPTYALTEKGVVKGYDNQTQFKPANKCTRAQMVTFIWRLAGSPEPKTKECKFSDVKNSDYFYKACLWGNENHIVEGYKDGTFGPQIVCARRHAVTFLWRLAGKPEPAGDKTKFAAVFKDIDEDDYFFEATIWATEQKIVAGYDDHTFRPDGDCLRRQMVTFLYKYDKFVNNK
ncbi:MAG: S-layer homology domain-containing protein [Clostridiales bacterium]|nr:S-layer homology domain-containing protein [Clostridiales bacterium]